jgi:hypothetical protein
LYSNITILIYFCEKAYVFHTVASSGDQQRKPRVEKRLAAGALLAGGPGVVAVDTINYAACLVAATNQHVLCLFLSAMSKYKVESCQVFTYPTVQIVQVKRRVFGLEKMAVLATPIGKLWLANVPRMLVGKLDSVLDATRQQQASTQQAANASDEKE